MNIREQVFYGRQSVDKKDSISIESQFEFCQYELRGANCKKYTDKGYSGKNTDRPQFQAMIRDIEKGLISKVIVYKLDRISRSIIDFAGMMELFGKYNVEFISATEKFDTSTPMGRAMLNICIVFAQLERETIQRRVTDAFYSRCQRGFHMGGKTTYGFKLEPTVMEGVKTKMLISKPETDEAINLMFELFADPQTSLGDVARYFTENGIKLDGKVLSRERLSGILRNPAYAQADLDLYDFFKSQGTVIANDAADFAGTNGCYLYQGRGNSGCGKNELRDQILVIAPHEGRVSSDVWLACRKKLMTNTAIGGTVVRKAKNTWLAGKIRCGRCGAGLVCMLNPSGLGYFHCRKRVDSKSCEGCGTLRAWEVEDSVYSEMCQKMADFQTLTGGNPTKANPKLTALNVELAQVEAEIEKLIDTLSGANKTLLAYANGKVEELDAKRQSLTKAIADMTAEAVSPEHIKRLSGYLNDWNNIGFDDRRLVVDGLISSIQATTDDIHIEWKI
jgi:DNA invertase Pin-like site-specific DNA recombinase